MAASSGMPRVLVIGYCFPPSASPEAFVTAKLLKNIKDCEVDVVTLADGNVSEIFDHEMGRYADGINGKVYRVSVPKYLQRLTRMPRLPLRPDRWSLLNHHVLKTTAGLIEQGKYDCLITRSQYHSAHLVGLKLKAKFPDLPWVACFSDPWSRADHQKNVTFFSAWSDRQEKKVLAAADRLVFPSSGLKNHFINDLPELETKSSVLPHSFDTEIYKLSPETRGEGDKILVARLFGSFYGTRSPDVLFAAIDQMQIPAGRKFRLELYGPWHSAYEDLEERYADDPQKSIVYQGHIPHLEALNKMQQAHLLLLVDAPGKGKSFYLPSKIVDYIGAKRPVLALCREGLIADITRKIGGVVADPADVNDVRGALEMCAANQCMYSDFNTDFIQGFEAGNVAGKFRSLIEELI
ncbi:glycosyltransferase [Thalassospira povalilytica]|uniref:Glycosyltransferase n=1 Tax=Thalassospira povalilytica TaxID=732237 RepID=A0A8I1M618_9PROT|nr:glycosyltransferase [Thalassospira povalilytica]MBN8195935.1 glycosyltransferase [Thalassospira povalilytica]